MLRKVCKVHLVLLCCLLAAGVELRAEVISSLEPAILRMDAFVAARYDANRALVFFASQPVVAGAGIPADAWPREACTWAGKQAQLRLAQGDAAAQWEHSWPGGADFAPSIGAPFTLALGGSTQIHGTLSDIGYLPLCNTTWVIGLVSVVAADRELYRSTGTEGFIAYAAGAASVEQEPGSRTAMATAGAVLRGETMDAVARAKIEAALKARAQTNYSDYMEQREAIFAGDRPSPRAKSAADETMLAGAATMSYTVQAVTMATEQPRYYVRAVWRGSRGEGLYRMDAWFSSAWELETVPEAMALHGTGDAMESVRVLNVYSQGALPMLEQNNGLEDSDGHTSYLLMEEIGAKGALYSLKRSTQGGLTPTGIYFSRQCR